MTQQPAILWLILGGTALMVVDLWAEAIGHERRLRRIPIRVHVNGSRGKTSVTRRLAAALRAGGVRTVAKVTGDEPLLILPDGTEQPVRRRGPARIQEQMWFVKRAAELGAEAVVVECMALAPELQRISEERMIRSTLGVITNVRPDHFEVMGEDLDAIADSLAGTIPRRGVLVTADRRYFARFAAAAAARGSRAVLAGSEGQAEGIAPEEEHAAIVAAVCGELKTPAVDVAPQPPSGSMPWRLECGHQQVFFVNAFSANDPVSTRLLRQSIETWTALPRPCVALLNNRADRPRRLLSFVEALAVDANYAAVAVCGSLAPLAGRKLRATGREVWELPEESPEAMLGEIGRRVGGEAFSVVGMGNAKGAGFALARYCEEKGVACR